MHRRIVAFYQLIMAANDPGIPPLPEADDPTRGAELPPARHHDPDYEPEPPIDSGDRPVAPDQFDPKYETTRKEIWAYYSYYIGASCRTTQLQRNWIANVAIGNNGLTLFNFAPTAFQNLLYQAAGDAEVLNFAGRDRTINSIVLLSNGISFAIQSVLFLIIGSYAGESRSIEARE